MWLVTMSSTTFMPRSCADAVSERRAAKSPKWGFSWRRSCAQYPWYESTSASVSTFFTMGEIHSVVTPSAWM